MTHFRRWHLALIPIPIIGWLLLAAYWLDEALPCEALRPELGRPSPGSGSRRLAAGLIDLGIAMLSWLALPPAIAWLLASTYLLFRDAGASPFGIGKRLLGLRAAPIGYTRSFERNLPLLVPYLGPLVEAALIAGGSRRLGDRLARTNVG